jgi:Domain of unknown function (DUF3597)
VNAKFRSFYKFANVNAAMLNYCVYIIRSGFANICDNQNIGGFMSIFGKIKDAIFGKKAVAAVPAVAAPVAAAPEVTPVSVAISDVDVISHLEAMAAENGQKLNWRSSIVDLMKLVGMESSLQERKDLAMELGYTGDLAGSAEMNIWLHKAVMRELAANGGVVPADLLD